MINIFVPELGESVVEARVLRWIKKTGDHVSLGEAVVELETEKVNLEVGAEKAGVLASIARQEGEDVKIGEVLGTIDEGAGAAAAGPSDTSAPPAAAPAAAPNVAAPAPPPSAPAPSAPAPSAPSQPPSAPASAQPAPPPPPAPPSAPRAAAPESAPAAPPPKAQSAQESAQADTARPASAPERPSRAAADGRPEERTRMSKRRLTIARRLVEAQRTAAMLTTFNEVDMSAVMALRERHKDAFKKQHGVGLGIASFFVKASVAALRAFPQLNAEIQGDEIVLKRYYDIGMAVGAEGGLVVPVIRDADRLSFPAIETAIRSFAAKAADGTLTLEDLAGGTFTITNGGVFGSLMSTPILNPPQVGILGLHKVQDRAVPVNGRVEIRPMMYLALSYDHRMVDGREAVQFLVAVKEFVEDPGHMLIEG